MGILGAPDVSDWRAPDARPGRQRSTSDSFSGRSDSLQRLGQSPSAESFRLWPLRRLLWRVSGCSSR
jgi:hypothetical protein